MWPRGGRSGRPSPCHGVGVEDSRGEPQKSGTVAGRCGSHLGGQQGIRRHRARTGGGKRAGAAAAQRSSA
eukprot:14966625-Alexandrium_andersonii.AAC.1